MLTVHHLGISQSERIVWLCEELAIPYELKRYDRDATTRLAPAAYKALHPMGTAPVITDGGVVLSESGAIMEYIIGKYGRGRLAVAPDKPNFAKAYLKRIGGRPAYRRAMEKGDPQMTPMLS